jgi:hypothetical protein
VIRLTPETKNVSPGDSGRREGADLDVSRAAIAGQMRDLAREMRQKLTHDNAAALYGLS